MAAVVGGHGDAGVTADEVRGGVAGRDAVATLAGAVAEAGKHLDAVDVRGALVARHFVGDAVRTGEGVCFVERFTCQARARDGWLGGRRHGVAVCGIAVARGRGAVVVVLVRRVGFLSAKGRVVGFCASGWEGVVAVEGFSLGAGFGFFLLFAAEDGDAGLEALVLDLVLEKGVEEFGIFGWVRAGHHEEAAAETGGVVGAKGSRFGGEMGVAVGFEDGVALVEFAEAVVEAERVASGDSFVELANEDCAIVRVDKVADEFANQFTAFVTGEGFGGGRDVENAAVGSEDVEKISQFFEDALRPIAALGEFGERAIPATVAGGRCSEISGERTGTGAAHNSVLGFVVVISNVSHGLETRRRLNGGKAWVFATNIHSHVVGI